MNFKDAARYNTDKNVNIYDPKALKRGEEGQPHQFLVRATSKSSFFQYYLFKVSNSQR